MFYYEEFGEIGWELSKFGISKTGPNNYVKKLRRDALEYGDAEFVLPYLEGKKSADPSFFMRYATNAYGSLENLFWCDRQLRPKMLKMLQMQWLGPKIMIPSITPI